MRDIRFRAWDNTFKSMTDPYIDNEMGYQYLNAIFVKYDRYLWMQFTGYEDSKQQDLWEDDLVIAYDLVWKIVFSHGAWCLIRPGRYKHLNNVYCTKIGNVHEHPQLMYSKPQGEIKWSIF